MPKVKPNNKSNKIDCPCYVCIVRAACEGSYYRKEEVNKDYKKELDIQLEKNKKLQEKTGNIYLTDPELLLKIEIRNNYDPSKECWECWDWWMGLDMEEF